MKNHWSSTAAVFGFVVAIVLILASDIPSNFFIGILCPPPIIFGGLPRLFNFTSFPTLAIVLLVAISAAGNAIWYMLVTETLRLLITKLKSWYPL